MTINFSKLNFSFSKKPLVVGGKAMEYYGLRKAGDDIDLIVTKEDLKQLVQMYPHSLKDLWGDFGVSVHGFEIWKTIRYFNYDFLSEGAAEETNYLVISLEKLLLHKAMAMKIAKYRKDLELIVEKITENQSSMFNSIKQENEQIISRLSDFQFIEKVGPESNS